jgi:hypothetical protein
MEGQTLVADNLFVPKDTGKAYLKDSFNRLFPASIFYTTDGNNNVIPITLGGSTGGSTGVTSVSASAPILSSGGSTPNISIPQASSVANGYLASADYSTFNGKQSSGNYITALTSDVTASGPGSVAATVSFVGGSSAAGVHTAELLANAATDLNTASTIVKRDSAGSFKAGIVKLISDTIQFGTVDGFSRPQIWNKMTNAVLRLGSWGADGDATNVNSEGIVVYADSFLAPIDATHGGYARIKGNRFGLFLIDAGLPAYTGGDYYFRADSTQLFFKDNTATTTFSIQRSSGNTVIAGSANVSGGVQLSTSGAQPTCDSSHRGLMWNIEGGVGVADIFQVCQKNAGDLYVWATH